MSFSLRQYSTFWHIMLMILVLCLIALTLLFILNQFSPFKECEDKSDDYEVKMGNKIYTCGELKAINTTIAGFDN